MQLTVLPVQLPLLHAHAVHRTTVAAAAADRRCCSPRPCSPRPPAHRWHALRWTLLTERHSAAPSRHPAARAVRLPRPAMTPHSTSHWMMRQTTRRRRRYRRDRRRRCCCCWLMNHWCHCAPRLPPVWADLPPAPVIPPCSATSRSRGRRCRCAWELMRHPRLKRRSRSVHHDELPALALLADGVASV